MDALWVLKCPVLSAVTLLLIKMLILTNLMNLFPVAVADVCLPPTFAWSCSDLDYFETKVDHFLEIFSTVGLAVGAEELWWCRALGWSLCACPNLCESKSSGGVWAQITNASLVPKLCLDTRKPLGRGLKNQGMLRAQNPTALNSL